MEFNFFLQALLAQAYGIHLEVNLWKPRNSCFDIFSSCFVSLWILWIFVEITQNYTHGGWNFALDFSNM